MGTCPLARLSLLSMLNHGVAAAAAGAARSNQEQPGAAKSSQEQPGAARSSKEGACLEIPNFEYVSKNWQIDIQKSPI